MFFNLFKKKIKNIVTEDQIDLLRKMLDRVDSIDNINMPVIRGILSYSDDWPQDLKDKMESILVMDKLMR